MQMAFIFSFSDETSDLKHAWAVQNKLKHLLCNLFSHDALVG